MKTEKDMDGYDIDVMVADESQGKSVYTILDNIEAEEKVGVTGITKSSRL